MDRSLIKSADLGCVGSTHFPLFTPVKTAIRPSATMCQHLFRVLTCHASSGEETKPSIKLKIRQLRSILITFGFHFFLVFFCFVFFLTKFVNKATEKECKEPVFDSNLCRVGSVDFSILKKDAIIILEISR